ncbi:MAG: YiiX/YebB-like N1pC/P60 family cysteine hydrolase [Myxococcota bacterium]
MMLAFFLSAAASAAPPDPAMLREGDIVVHKSRSTQSAALAAATHSPYTHTGLVFRRQGTWQVLEAVQPVRWTALADWVRRGRDQHIVVLRPKAPFDATKVRAAAEAYLGRSYDLLFAWSDDRIYCSELVYKAYDQAADLQLGALVPLSTFDLEPEPVQALIRQRVGRSLNRSEPVVAPASLLEDEDLHWVFSNDPAHAGR